MVLRAKEETHFLWLLIVDTQFIPDLVVPVLSKRLGRLYAHSVNVKIILVVALGEQFLLKLAHVLAHGYDVKSNRIWRLPDRSEIIREAKAAAIALSREREPKPLGPGILLIDDEIVAF